MTPSPTAPATTCSFAGCDNPATVTVERQRRCGHTEQPNIAICGTCTPPKSPKPSPCTTCGEWNHIHSIEAL